MNEAQVTDLIVDWLIDNTRHIVANQSSGNWEMIDFDDSYLEMLVYDLSYDEENSLFDFERQFNRDYAGEWEMNVGFSDREFRHTIVCQRAY